MSQAGINSLATAPSPPAVPTQFTTDAGIAVPALNNLNVLGGVGASTSGAGSTITVNVTSASFDWNTVTSATNPNQVVIENGYKTNDNASRVVLLLPATATLGDTFRVMGYGTAGWQITQNANQKIYLGTQTTSVGVAGSLASTQTHDTIELTCIVSGASTEWQESSVIGNITVV